MRIGTKVVVQRDETKYPSKGSWPRFRGKRGVVTGTSHGEIGVSFSNDAGAPADAWFQRYELTEWKRKKRSDAKN